MKRKAQGFRRMSHGLWKARGEWIPTYVLNQQRADGIEYQHYALDANDKLVYAGVTRHERMNQANANQIHRVWRRWRNEYDTRFTGKFLDYPAKHIAPVTTLIVFPIDAPEQQQQFAV